MNKIYSAQDILMLGHLKNVLEARGIECVVKNMYLTGAVGEIPPIECWPELWVVDDARYAEAQAVVEKALSPLGSIKKPWKCAKCGEEIEGQFTECWSCGESCPDRRNI
ncbi:MAG: DUF2007 domain-containing protein [Candidatus Binatia bacterium]